MTINKQMSHAYKERPTTDKAPLSGQTKKPDEDSNPNATTAEATRYNSTGGIGA